MRKVLSYVSLVVALILAFLAYKNSQLTPETLDLAIRTTCGIQQCADKRPRAKRSTILSHQYEFKTAGGPYIVTCRRSAILFGAWKCSNDLESGRIGLDKQY